MENFDDTIAAVSTPAGVGGISIVRMSGKNAVSILKKVFKKAGGKDVFNIKSHTINYGRIFYDEKLIDEVLVSLMLAPKSYTKEDIVEINCHGGARTVKSIMDVLIKNGARPAAPGEFTKRAFLNGRIDLSMAEAVIDLINSKTELSERASLNRLEGKLSKKIKEIREEILTMTAHIEVNIDYPEHDDEEFSYGMVFEKTTEILKKINNLIETADMGKILKDGVKTVILGKPNVGKSSLMNCMIDKERAIVTDIPGTTRDALEESIDIGGIALNIIDTAGIRKTDDIIEKIGVEKSKNYAKEADFILFAADGSKELDSGDFEILKFIKESNKNAVAVMNKSDIGINKNIDKIYEYIDKKNVVYVSAKEGSGIDILFEKIKNLFLNGKISLSDEVIISGERNKYSLLNAKKSLENVIETIERGMPQDFLSMDLNDAYSHLGEIIGETIGEDVIDKIFSEFCLGK